MPIKVQRDLPAKAILEEENIFIMDEDRAMPAPTPAATARAVTTASSILAAPEE